MRQNLFASDAFDFLFASGSFGSTRLILTGNLTLTSTATPLQFLDANGTNRTITLPAFKSGSFFVICNVGNANDLIVQNASATTLCTIPFDASAFFFSSKLEWKPLKSFEDLSVFGASGASHSAGLVPDPGVTPGTGKVLFEDGLWKDPGSSGIVTDAFSFVTDGTTTATGTGNDTLKFRSSDSSITLVVTDNDLTHGDNLDLVVNPANVDHNSLENFVGNKHIDHSLISLTVGTGLTGGGNLTATRDVSLNLTGLPTTVVASGDEFPFYDITGITHGKLTLAAMNAALDHDALANFVVNEHIDHSTVSISPGAGLAGGGDLTASRSLALSFSGLSVLPEGLSAGDLFAVYDLTLAGHYNVTLTTLSSAVSGTLGLGTMATQNASAVAITGGTITGITDLVVADGGTGRSTSTTAYGLLAAGTTATGIHQTLAAGATTELLVGGGASALPVWTTATGTGAPVRAGSPALTGTPTAPTAAADTNTTQLATTAFAKAEADAAQSASQPLDADLTTIAGLTATTDNFMQAKASAWASRTPAQVNTDLLAANFTPSYTGAVAMPLRTKIESTITPREFGAAANGTTTGDDVAIQAAIDAAVVIVGSGDTDGAFVHIDGEGRAYVVSAPLIFTGATSNYIDFSNGRLIADPAGAWNLTAAVTGVTKANPGVVTAVEHKFRNGDRVTFASVGGMTELNGNTYIVANKTADTFELQGTDTTAFTTYTSGGTADNDFARGSVIEIKSSSAGHRIHDLFIDCNHICNGINQESTSGGSLKIYQNIVRHQVRWGIRLSGSGDGEVFDNETTEYTLGEAEYAEVDYTGTLTSGSPTITAVPSTTGLAVGMTVSGIGIPFDARILSFVVNTSVTMTLNATATGAVTFGANSFHSMGFYLDSNDMHVEGNMFRWCLCPMYFGADGSTTMFVRNHPYNGQSGSGTRRESRNMYFEVGSNSNIFGINYLDNGIIEMRSFDHVFMPNRIAATASIVNSCIFRLIATSAAQDLSIATRRLLLAGFELPNAVAADTTKLVELGADSGASWNDVTQALFDIGNADPYITNQEHLLIGAHDAPTVMRMRGGGVSTRLAFESIGTTAGSEPFVGADDTLLTFGYGTTVRGQLDTATGIWRFINNANNSLVVENSGSTSTGGIDAEGSRASDTAAFAEFRGDNRAGGASVVGSGALRFHRDAANTTVKAVLELEQAGVPTDVYAFDAADLSINGNIVYRAGGTDVPVTDGGTGSSTAAGARTNLGLGTAAVENIGTSGATVPLLSTANTWSDDLTLSKTTQPLLTLRGGSNSGNDPEINFEKARGLGTPSVITSTDDIGTIRFKGYDGTSYVEGAAILADTSGTISTGVIGGILKISTNGVVAATFDATQKTTLAELALTTDLAVTEGGTGASTAAGARTNLGLGTAAVEAIGTSGATVPLNNSANTFGATQSWGAYSITGAGEGMQFNFNPNNTTTVLGISRNDVGMSRKNIEFFTPSGQAGTITTTDAVTAYNTTSDERLKDFLGELSAARAIAVIKADPVREFTWKANGRRAIGWGAQTSYNVSPDLALPPIEEALGDCWAMDYGHRTPYLWAAVSSLLDEITALKVRVEELEKKVK